LSGYNHLHHHRLLKQSRENRYRAQFEWAGCKCPDNREVSYSASRFQHDTSPDLKQGENSDAAKTFETLERRRTNTRIHYSMSSGHVYGLMEEYIYSPTLDPSSIAGEISRRYPPTSRTEVKPAKSVFPDLWIFLPQRALRRKRVRRILVLLLHHSLHTKAVHVTVPESRHQVRHLSEWDGAVFDWNP